MPVIIRDLQNYGEKNFKEGYWNDQHLQNTQMENFKEI